MAMPTYTPDWSYLTDAMKNTYILGSGWVLPVILLFIIMLSITRDTSKWKILGFPLLILMSIMQIPVNALVLTIAGILFVIESLSLDTGGVLLKSVRETFNFSGRYREAESNRMDRLNKKLSFQKKKEELKGLLSNKGKVNEQNKPANKPVNEPVNLAGKPLIIEESYDSPPREKSNNALSMLLSGNVKGAKKGFKESKRTLKRNYRKGIKKKDDYLTNRQLKQIEDGLREVKYLDLKISKSEKLFDLIRDEGIPYHQRLKLLEILKKQKKL